MSFLIRPVEEADAERITVLLNRIIAAGGYTIMEGALTVADQLDFIRTFPERGLFLAAVDLDSPPLLGIQDVMPLSPETPANHHVGEISTFVELSLRGQGIGRRLSQETFHAARRKGFRKLRANIRADNPQAVAFYHAMGFETIGRAKEHALVHGVFIDEIIAERDLT